MDEVLVGAAHDVVVGHGDGVHAASRRLQHVHTLQVPDVPDLREMKQRQDETLSQRGDPFQPFCHAQSQPGSMCAQITPLETNLSSWECSALKSKSLLCYLAAQL